MISGPVADDTQALLHMAVTHHRQGRYTAAEMLYREALARVPTNLDVQHNLGAVLASQGRLKESAPYLVAALGKNPGNPQYWNAALSVLQMLGDHEELVRVYQRLVTQQPHLAQAYLGLGNALRQLDRMEEAKAAWKKAVKIDPHLAKAHNNLGVLAKARGDLATAETCFRAAIAAAPGFAGAVCNLGTILEQRGLLRDAEQCFRKAIALEPSHPTARTYLGEVLCELGCLREALAVFMEHAHRFGTTAFEAGPAYKNVHDREQQAWMGGTNVSGLVIRGGARLATAAVSRENAPAVTKAWQESHPSVAVVDDFLTPAALAALREFCLGSTIWRQAFPGGYLGALPQHGFAAPLLGQIGEEMARFFPEIFKDHPLLQLWGFKYGGNPDGKGINLHADFAAVNVNFWITPDAANRDPQHGGLVIWDKAAPLDWDFETYNNDQHAMRAFLQASGASAITVPYRANRAIFFDSDLFHETDRLDFRAGYENRRINVTFLYGWRGGARKAKV